MLKNLFLGLLLLLALVRASEINQRSDERNEIRQRSKSGSIRLFDEYIIQDNSNLFPGLAVIERHISKKNGMIVLVFVAVVSLSLGISCVISLLKSK
jgi:hypothetical protein